MKIFIFILISLHFIACNDDHKASKILKVTFGSDSCYKLLDSSERPVRAFRGMRILKNSLSDSIGFGFAIIPPGRTGKINYLRYDTSVDKILYLDDDDDVNSLPKTDMICINRYQNRNFIGELIIEYKY